MTSISTFDTAHTDSRTHFQAEVTCDWRSVADAWGREAGNGAGTPFQKAEWVSSFYEAVKCDRSISPLIVTLREGGAVAMRLALVLRQQDGLRRVEFADLGMTDYNAPLLGPAAPTDLAGARTAMRSIKKVLSADLLHFTKMPPLLNGRPNPFTLDRPMTSAVNGNLLTVGEDWDAFRHAGFERTFRKELERSGRVFAKAGGVFRRITTRQDALAMLVRMEEQQRARMEEIGQHYNMEQPVTAAFYRSLMGAVESGFAVLTTLEAKDELVGGLLGVRDGKNYVMIRLTHAGREWSNCSPGRLLIEQTLALLHGEGYRHFDFSVGNYAYKRRFGPVRTPLYDTVSPLSVKGLMPAVKMKFAAEMRKYPETRVKLRGLLGKSATREEI